jgi:triacylglycerol lipase
MKNNVFLYGLLAAALCLTGSQALARADKTTYPVIFAHGMMGFDQLVGLDYFGNDYGVFVGDPCDQFLETTCNRKIDRKQEAYAAEVNPFQSSEYRGLQLADDIEGYMATVGAECVNIVGHSQGGLDARKAAKVLYDRQGHQVVKALISLSSPHRGSPVAGNVLYKGEDGFNAMVAWLANNMINPLFYVEKGDYFASMKAFFYDDWDPEDGEITGGKAFNNNYPMDNTYVKYYGSLITSDQGGLNPILLAMGLLAPLDIDGDGWCGDADENGDLLDCNADGAAGEGDGEFEDGDDDGLVGLNSQQMGPRLTYEDSWWYGTGFVEDQTTGYVCNLNQPNEIQSTSYSSVLPQDHLDVCGLGIIPYVINDKFDEMQFYADLIDYIADQE